MEYKTSSERVSCQGRSVAPELSLGGGQNLSLMHADWGSDPKKRWMATSAIVDGVATVSAPELVGELPDLSSRLLRRADGRALVMGFDFPIGVPSAYAERAGVRCFSEFLAQLGKAPWQDFFLVAERPEEIDVKRPFYPQRPGGTQQRHLLDALGVEEMTELLRLCERATPSRGRASPLFWTLGGKQVGKAAIIGWRDVILPAVASSTKVNLWPFDGQLNHLLEPGSMTIVETYPAEACVHLGLDPPGRSWSKTCQEGRAQQAGALLGWAKKREVQLADDLRALIEDGFGQRKDAEDPLDAVLGLFGMIEVLLGHRSPGAPRSDEVRAVEGWILGQEVDQ